jgi:hypothetical protein
MGATVTDPPGVPSMRRVSVSDPRLSGHPQIWSEAFSAEPGIGSFGSVGFSGKDVHVARLRALGAALIVTALLSAVLGCEDEPEPDIADPPQSSTAPSPTETESSPTTSPTPEALTPEETVRAWFAAFTVAMQTGDVTGVSQMSAGDCASCQRLIKKVVDLYAKGGSLTTKGWKPEAIAAQPGSADDPPVLIAQVTQARQVLLDADGEQVDVTPETVVAMRLTLSMSEAWVVNRLEILT